MTASNRTKHAIVRMSQRGFRADDPELIGLFGTEVEGGTIMLRRDAQAVEREAKRLIDHAWRLVGKRCVEDGNTVITAYHSTRAKERQLLRRDSHGR